MRLRLDLPLDIGSGRKTNFQGICARPGARQAFARKLARPVAENGNPEFVSACGCVCVKEGEREGCTESI